MEDATELAVGVSVLPHSANRSFRRTLEAENKSSRTMQAYTDAVRLLAVYCEYQGQPPTARAYQRQ